MTLPMDFDTLNEMWEDFENWGLNTPELRRLRKSHQSFRKMWDGQKKAKRDPGKGEMPFSETLINEIRRAFPKEKGTQKGRPMGDFKDIMESDHEAIYNYLINEFIKPRKNANGETESYFEAMKYQCKWLWDEFFKDDHRWLNWDEKAYVQGMSLMMYSSSIGIYQENKVHHALGEWLERNPKAAKLFSYERADADEWESKDVDGLFVSKETGKPIVKVSIKCNRALDREWIWRVYRSDTGKKKTVPDIYIGYHTPEDEKLDQIGVEANLKELLRRGIDG